MQKTTLKRRDFLSAAGAAVAAVTIVPRHVVAKSRETPPSEKLNLAGIGVGSMGRGDVREVAAGNNIIALCDVDWDYAAPAPEGPSQGRSVPRFPQDVRQAGQADRCRGGRHARP